MSGFIAVFRLIIKSKLVKATVVNNLGQYYGSFLNCPESILILFSAVTFGIPLGNLSLTGRPIGIWFISSFPGIHGIEPIGPGPDSW